MLRAGRERSTCKHVATDFACRDRFCVSDRFCASDAHRAGRGPLTLVHVLSHMATRSQACYCAPRSSAVRWSYELARTALESSTRALSSRVISVVISSFARRRRSRVWLLSPAGCGSRAHT